MRPDLKVQFAISFHPCCRKGKNASELKTPRLSHGIQLTGNDTGGWRIRLKKAVSILNVGTSILNRQFRMLCPCPIVNYLILNEAIPAVCRKRPAKPCPTASTLSHTEQHAVPSKVIKFPIFPRLCIFQG
jgi:hypothetical protein